MFLWKTSTIIENLAIYQIFIKGWWRSVGRLALKSLKPFWIKNFSNGQDQHRLCHFGERTGRGVIPLKLKWSDVGSWTASKCPNHEWQRELYQRGDINFDSKNLLVYGGSNKLIATIGVKIWWLWTLKMQSWFATAIKPSWFLTWWKLEETGRIRNLYLGSFNKRNSV